MSNLLNTYQQRAIRALENMRRDYLYRAQHAFSGLTAEQMAEQYGQSGKTCAEILAEYEESDAEVTRAIEWVKGAK